ncbi:MAG TPA: hypothetical protein VFG07_07255 [Thermoplasmata archaeon]|nr:hypothetical protein [Thermoplasmata archaeon]
MAEKAFRVIYTTQWLEDGRPKVYSEIVYGLEPVSTGETFKKRKMDEHKGLVVRLVAVNEIHFSPKGTPSEPSIRLVVGD